jgi:hypothetical protein
MTKAPKLTVVLELTDQEASDLKVIVGRGISWLKSPGTIGRTAEEIFGALSNAEVWYADDAPSSDKYAVFGS